jgi:hypothetical protein
MKPTAPLQCNFSEVVAAPSTSSRFPASLVRFAIRVFAFTRSRRIVFNDVPWLISFSLGA